LAISAEPAEGLAGATWWHGGGNSRKERGLEITKNEIFYFMSDQLIEKAKKRALGRSEDEQNCMNLNC
jgi:hypothetical protein